MIKILAKSIRQYKRPSVLTAVQVSAEVILEVIIPLLMAELIDKGIDAGNMSVLVKYSIALLISALISLVFGALGRQKCWQLPPAALQKICGRICTITYRIFPLQASTIHSDASIDNAPYHRR